VSQNKTAGQPLELFSQAGRPSCCQRDRVKARKQNVQRQLVASGVWLCGTSNVDLTTPTKVTVKNINPLTLLDVLTGTCLAEKLAMLNFPPTHDVSNVTVTTTATTITGCFPKASSLSDLFLHMIWKGTSGMATSG